MREVDEPPAWPTRFGPAIWRDQKARHFPVAIAALFSHIGPACGPKGRVSGCSSGVEHNLAKVGVERSNRFTRSKSSLDLKSKKGPGNRAFLLSGAGELQEGAASRVRKPQCELSQTLT